MNEYDDILNRIVEEFYDTGRLKLSEEIEFDVDNEDFGVESEEEIEIDGDEISNTQLDFELDGDSENISQKEIDYIVNEYESLTNDEKIKNVLLNPPFNNNPSQINSSSINGYVVRYIVSKEANRGNSDVFTKEKFEEFLAKVNTVLGTNYKNIKGFRELTSIAKPKKEGGLTQREILMRYFDMDEKDISLWLKTKKDRQRVVGQKNLRPPKTQEEVGDNFIKLVDYLTKTNLSEITLSLDDLLKKFNLKRNSKSKNEAIPQKKEIIDNLIGEFKENLKVKFYLDYIGGNIRKGKRSNWETFVKYSKGINEIITKNKIPDEVIKEGLSKVQKYMKSLKIYFNKIKEKEYCYIFNDNCKLSSSDIEKVMDFFGKTYENSFLNKGFKKESKSVESRIHDLDKVGFSFPEKIKSDDFDVDEISKFIIKNIENYLEISGITKYDILANRDIKDEGGNVIIPKDGKVEVKDINKQDSYLSEFLASPVKKTEYGIRNNPIYLKRYNDVIGKVYNHLKNKWEDDIKEKIKNDLEGIIISNNIFVPNDNKNDNIEFYLSNVGRSNPENQLRIAVRYHINKNNWRNFYKIGDDGILYPLKKEPNIATKKKRIYETKSKLDNIIENFFDTGKFVF